MVDKSTEIKQNVRMSVYTLIAIITTIAVFIGYLSHRLLKMQSTIAIMVGALGLSLFLLILQHTGLTNLTEYTRALLIRTNFHALLMNGMLSFLLFAGSLTIDFSVLRTQKWIIGTLASISTVASAALIGILVYYLLPMLGISLPFLYCLLFGALISPTDPIAVLATFKEIGAPKVLETCVAGESLFNDGVGIVIFTTIYQLAFANQDASISQVTLLFFREALGGILYGVLLGLAANHLIKTVTDYSIAILITLAIVTGGYTLALHLDISGPLAMVVAGIFVGNKEAHASSVESSVRKRILTFWEVIDEVLNAILFMLIGFELLTIQASPLELVAILLVIPLVLAVRFVTVATPLSLRFFKRKKHPYMLSILTWGGLRGGLAVALALSLPPSTERDLILALTYGVVAFSVIVQGITIKPLARRAHRAHAP